MASVTDDSALELQPLEPTLPATPTQLTAQATVVDKTLSMTANLAQLLPTGTLLVFQALAPSFAHRGVDCYPANRFLTAGLMIAGVASCVFFSLTDSLVGGDGKLYYGLATLGGLCVLNYDAAEEDRGVVFHDIDMGRYRLRPVDAVHVAFTVLVFLAIAFADGMIQHCLFPGAGPNPTELLVNLPLAAGVVSTLVFVVFPTSRRGIGYTNTTATTTAATTTTRSSPK